MPCRFHPLLTPSGCAGGNQYLVEPPLSPQQAADIYAGEAQHGTAAEGPGGGAAWPGAARSVGLAAMPEAAGSSTATALRPQPACVPTH